MATNKNAVIRYRALDKCFRDYRHRYYLEDLIEKCEDELRSFNYEANVSRRQIFDDIRFMESEAGWNIPLDRLRDGKKTYYRYYERDFTINAQPLTDEEAQQIETLILTLSRFRGLPCNEWVDEVISNLEWRFNLKGNKENVVSFEQNQNLKGLDKLSAVLDVTSNHQVVEILYHNFKNGGRAIFFTVHPYYVKQFNNRWFLFGLDDKFRNIDTIALDRIVKMDVAEDIPFIPNNEIDFEHYFDDIVGVTIPDKGVGKLHIELQFSESRFPYVTSKPIHRTQDIVNEEERIICIDVRPNNELITQILSFGSDVKVLSPEPFRKLIVNKIKESFEIYSSGAE